MAALFQICQDKQGILTVRKQKSLAVGTCKQEARNLRDPDALSGAPGSRGGSWAGEKPARREGEVRNASPAPHFLQEEFRPCLECGRNPAGC